MSQTITIDGTDVTDNGNVYVDWDNTELGNSVADGSASLGQLVLKGNEQWLANNIGAAAHKVVVWDVDGTTLARGRVLSVDVERGPLRADRDTQWTFTVGDYNDDLKGLVLLYNVSRPAETDVERVTWAIGFLANGSPRADTVLDPSGISASNAVDMDAKVYDSGTSLLEILDECKDIAGKTYGVMVDGTFLYTVPSDTTYMATLSISDRESEVDFDTVWAPDKAGGPPFVSDSGEVISDLLFRYGQGTASVISTSPHTSDVYWAGTASDSEILTPTMAQAMADSIVNSRDDDSRTYSYAIQPLTADKLGDIMAGQCISQKARAIPDSDDAATTPRIVELRWRYVADQHWVAIVRAGRPLRLQGFGGKKGSGPVAPTPSGAPAVLAGSWNNHTFSGGAANKLTGMHLSGASDGMLIAIFAEDTAGTGFNTLLYYPDQGDLGTSYAMTQIGSAATAGSGGTQVRVSAFKIDAPAATSGTGSQVTWSSGSGANHGFAVVAYYVTGLSSFTLISTTNTSVTGTVSTALSGIASGYLVIDGAGISVNSSPFLSQSVGGSADAGQTEDVVIDTTGLEYIGLGTSHEQSTGTSATLGWTGWASTGGSFSGVAQILIGVPGPSQGGTPTLGGPGEGDPGTGGTYTPNDAVIEHGDLSGKGGTMHDASQISYDNATSGLTADDVQAALDELAAGAATSVVVSHGTMGATETFDATAGHDHEGTQDANLTVTLTGASAGDAAWMTLVLTQDGGGGNTITLPASVAGKTAIEAAWDTTGSAPNVLTLFSYDGGTVWYGFLSGSSGAGATALDDLTDVTLTSETEDDQLQYISGQWVNNARRWEPVTTNPGTGPEIVYSGDEIVMTWKDY